MELDSSQTDSPFSSCMVCAAATAAFLDSYLPSQVRTTGASICFVTQPHSVAAAIDRINANTLFITRPPFSFAWPSSALLRRRTDRQFRPCRTRRRFYFRLFVFLFRTTAVSCLSAYPADSQWLFLRRRRCRTEALSNSFQGTALYFSRNYPQQLFTLHSWFPKSVNC